MRGDQSSNPQTKYIFYLREPITLEAVEEIYDTLDAYHPIFKYSHPKEDCISYTFDSMKYGSTRPLSNKNCWIDFKDYLKIYLENRDLPEDPTGRWAPYPPLGNGERQFEIQWYHTKYYDFAYIPDDEWDEISEFLEVLVKIAGILRPFFGIFGREDNFDTDYDIKDEEDLHERFEYYRSMLREEPLKWQSFFIDDALYNQIGPENLGKWAQMIIPVSDIGYFIEREGKALGGAFPPGSDYKFEKGRTFLELLYPKIISRLESEFPH